MLETGTKPYSLQLKSVLAYIGHLSRWESHREGKSLSFSTEWAADCLLKKIGYINTKEVCIWNHRDNYCWHTGAGLLFHTLLATML